MGSQVIPPPPPGFKMDAVPPPPPGFKLDTGGPSAPPEPGNHGLSEFLTSPHGYIREGLRTAGQGVKELMTPGSRLRGATDVLKGAGSVATPAALGAGGAALATAPLATVGALGLGAAGSELGGAGGRKLATAVSNNPDAPEFGEEAGSLMGGAAGGFAGSKLPKVAKAVIPTTESAGAKFQRVNQAVGDKPVNLNNASVPVIRALQLENAGAGAPPPVITKMAEHIPQHSDQPMPFSMSRDFQTNAGRLSTAESMNAKPQMKAQVAMLAKALAEENQSIAEQGGVGPLYKSAMNEYRRAMKLQGMKDTAGDVAKKTATRVVLGGLGVGAGIYGARRLFGE